MDTNQEIISETPDGLVKNYAIKDYRLEISDTDSQTVLYSREFKNMEQVNAFLGKIQPREVQPLTLKETFCISIFTRSLPSENFLQQAITKEQKEVGLCLRKIASVLGGCLFWRLNKLDGDPIRDWLFVEVPEGKLLHGLTWSIADTLEGLYALIQLLWKPISQELSSLHDAPDTSYDLFLELVRESFDYPYETYLQQGDRNLSPREREDLATALKNYWATPDLLKPNQEKILKKHKKSKPPFWLSTVLGVVKQDIKLYGNQAAKYQLSVYRYKVGMVHNEIAKWYRKHRKEGGFKTSTEANHNC